MNKLIVELIKNENKNDFLTALKLTHKINDLCIYKKKITKEKVLKDLEQLIENDEICVINENDETYYKPYYDNDNDSDEEEEYIENNFINLIESKLLIFENKKNIIHQLINKYTYTDEFINIYKYNKNELVKVINRLDNINKEYASIESKSIPEMMRYKDGLEEMKDSLEQKCNIIAPDNANIKVKKLEEYQKILNSKLVKLKEYLYVMTDDIDIDNITDDVL